MTQNTAVWLAPMAGVTDRSYRGLCRELAPALFTVSEMVSAKALNFGAKPTLELLRPAPGEALIPQLFGREPEEFYRACCRLKELGFVRVDVNMGCPAPKIAGHGEGSALMKEPLLAAAIVKACCKSGLPVSVKMRLGWDSFTACELAPRLEQAGACLLAVHGRTRVQMYSGRADRNAIAAVKKSVSVPVIANGDVTTPEDGLSLLADTGCDGVMVGRGAMGNPWLLQRLAAVLQGEPDPGMPDAACRIAMCKRHLALMVQDKGERVAVKEMRKHAAWYTAGLHSAAQARGRLNAAVTPEEMTAILDELPPLQMERD